MLDSNPIPPVLDGENGSRIGDGISLTRAVVSSIIAFICLMILPLFVFLVVPKFKLIFADMLGPGESLPAYTLFYLQFTDFLRENATSTLPAFLLLALICAGFVGFQKMFLPPKMCKWLTALFVVGLLGIISSGAVAMFLPLIEMMDKLGS